MGPTPEVAAVRRSVRGSLQGLPTGALVLVACSGGPDSVALAAAVAHEAPRTGLVAGAVTVDHGLQAGSAGRAAAVAEQLRGLGLDPVEVATVDGAGAGRRGAGPEAAARTARYRALDEAATRLGAAAVLLGHTRDDQAETVLLGLARGSGARSLAGMPAVRGRYRRPLLGLPRDVVRRAATGHRTWEDPHNADPAFARARARHDALPVLEKALGPGVAAALARSAGLLRADADALDGWARDALAAARTAAAPDAATDPATDPAPAAAPDAATDPATDPAPDPATGDGTQRLAVDVLAGLPAAVRSRVLRLAALTAGSPASALGAAHVAAIDRLVTDWHGQGPLDLPGGVSAARACGTLALSRPSRRTDRHEH